MKTNQQQREFNATAAGQRQMAYNAQDIGLCLMLSRKVKELGGTGWDESFIESANPVLLLSIRNDLTTEYNSLVSKQQA